MLATLNKKLLMGHDLLNKYISRGLSDVTGHPNPDEDMRVSVQEMTLPENT